MKTIYVAGPYTIDPVGCTAKAMDVADELEDLGLVAFLPHLSHFRHERRPRDYRHWMNVDLVWLRKCDAMFRIRGYSPGADEEEIEAKGLGKPVFWEIEEVARWLNGE